ncbi:MAG TPA: hypothetical protein PLY23_01520 [Alphaproteobacteria bacterium]|nr:hypothetical protein [Alphaproteobacteria bacterium]HQS93323.1 hypothetical protein [Alphaproteobacteria bacterium]
MSVFKNPDFALEDLEMLEDLCLSKVAEKLDQPEAKIYSHRDAWNEDSNKD